MDLFNYVVKVLGRTFKPDNTLRLMFGLNPEGLPVPMQVSDAGSGTTAITAPVGPQAAAAAVAVVPATITQQASIIVPASTTQSIPIGAREWTVTVLTGTATINGAAGLPAGFSDSGVSALTAPISVTTAATSTAYVRWGT